MKPSWKQAVRLVITLLLLAPFIYMFLFMGRSVVGHSDTREGLAELVAIYGVFIAIVGNFVTAIVKDLFNDGG